MEKMTVRLEDDAVAWVDATADALDRSTSWVIREAVDSARGASSALDTDTDVDHDLDDVLARLDDLDDRVDALEDAPRAPTDAGARESPQSVAVGDALEGWSHGRTPEARAASRDVVVAATTWLRDTGAEVRRSTLTESVDLEAIDDEDRSEKTLWDEVVRDAWLWLVERDVVDRPTVRTWQWVGDE